MTREVERTEAEKKKKKLCHKDIKRCCDSPALSRRYGFRGSVSSLLARSPDRPNVTRQVDSDGRVSSEGVKLGLSPFFKSEVGEGGSSVFSSLPGLNFGSVISTVGAGSGQKSRRGRGWDCGRRPPEDGGSPWEGTLGLFSWHGPASRHPTPPPPALLRLSRSYPEL